MKGRYMTVYLARKHVPNTIESKECFCQQGSLPEVNRAITDVE